MTTTELQEEIEKVLDSMSWSKKRLARELYYERNDCDDPVELKRAEEKVKKDLSRSTTRVALLKSYLNFIRSHRDFTSVDKVIPFYQPSGVLSDYLESELQEISKSLSCKSDH